MRTLPPILTSVEARRLLAVIEAGAQGATISLDLGRTEENVRLADGAAYVEGARLGRTILARIAKDANKCFEIASGEPRPIAAFSAATGWARSLLPTSEAPTTLVAGFPMHRIKGTTPLADTRAKVRALGRPRGAVLDTATGLGYTAIELAKTCTEVVTVELDPAAIALARRNPWSAELFSSAGIRRLEGDVGELLRSFVDGAFSAVLHDPPTLQLAGELYSAAFYAQLRRVLRPGGRLFHYVGDPAAGASTTRGVMRRLTATGFRNVRRYPAAFGVVAVAGGKGRTR